MDEKGWCEPQSLAEMDCRDVAVLKATVSVKSLFCQSSIISESCLQSTRDSDSHCWNGHDGGHLRQGKQKNDQIQYQSEGSVRL